jgi:hypothetical protein
MVETLIIMIAMFLIIAFGLTTYLLTIFKDTKAIYQP